MSSYFHNPRLYSPFPDEDSCPDSGYSRRDGPMEIVDSRQTICGIPCQSYFIAVCGYDGAVSTLFSDCRVERHCAENLFFDRNKFQQACRGHKPSPPINTPALSDNSHEPCLLPGSADGNGGSGHVRQRQRVHQHKSRNSQEETMSIATRRVLNSQNSPAVYEFYESRFKDCQQAACKLIAKAWVKVLAPKKQSTHPYTGSNAKAPDWWPKPWGLSREDRVRHKEPDHLYTKERIHLLIHILQLVTEPAQCQVPNGQNININLMKLEDATWESLSGWLAKSEANYSKKRFIEDILHVARLREWSNYELLEGKTPTCLGSSASSARSSLDYENRIPPHGQVPSSIRATPAALDTREDHCNRLAPSGSLVSDMNMESAHYVVREWGTDDHISDNQLQHIDEGDAGLKTSYDVNPSASVESFITAPTGYQQVSSSPNRNNFEATSVISTECQIEPAIFWTP